MAQDFDKYINEVEQALRLLHQKEDVVKSEKLKKYIGTSLQVLGLDSKRQELVNKKGFSFYSNQFDEVFIALNHIFINSNVFEVKNLPFIFLDKHQKNISIELQLITLPKWVKYVDNWAHSDSLSKYLTRLVENESTQQEVLLTLKKWNGSKNLWERRQSLIALFYYARTKQKHIEFKIVKEFIFPLLLDKEYYVQKAVGWTLRESYNVYPAETYQFIEVHITSISPTAFTTCLEKMTEQEKDSLKQKRKQK